MTYSDTKTICLQNLVNCVQSLKIFENRVLYQSKVKTVIRSMHCSMLYQLVIRDIRDKVQAKLQVFNAMRTFLLK